MSKVQLYKTPSNNHGCRGFSVDILPITDYIGAVIGGESCSSCWQVGHDSGESPIEIGAVVELDTGDWKAAAEAVGQSHNELVQDSPDDPQSDTTRVTPSELRCIGFIPQVAAAYLMRHKAIPFSEFKYIADGGGYDCCNQASAWVILRHWDSVAWHIEHQCQNPDHWTPNCEVRQARSFAEAVREMAELNSKQ